jgi:biopolymer transport protein ExbB/TolQ
MSRAWSFVPGWSRLCAGRSRPNFSAIEVGLPFLATVGSAAPFVGLFGTVWGIVNSFISIAQQKDTSLAVVAPGIAEALIATALGLAAAIPAVVAYNQVAVSLGRVSAKANASIAEIAKQLSRPQTRPVLQSAAE